MTMTEDRFKTLANAFGADFDSWPLAERAAATDFAASRPELAAAALADARALDRTLDAYVAGEAPARLRLRIIDAAPRQRAVGRAWRWIAAAGLGIGLAASCVAGVAAGFVLAPAGVTRMISVAAGAPENDVSALADPAGDAANS
jgi:hypothetical protein